jgi:hypothetical protein
MPVRIAVLLNAVRVLLGYGRHLAETVHERAPKSQFASIAVAFGTSNLAIIAAHLQRGILRAMALERFLLARAERGRDVDCVDPRARTAARPPVSTSPEADESQAAAPAAGPPQTAFPAAARRPASRPARGSGVARLADFYLPTPEELDAQVRSRAIGRSIVDICLDLAAMPGLCTGEFWNELFDIIRWFGGSISALVEEKLRREKTFDDEQDRRPTPGWDWFRRGVETGRKALGFLIGEAPVWPFAAAPVSAGPAAAVATGPP